MSTTKNIQMMEFNRQDYDVLYPAINENSIENLYLWEKGYWKNKDYHLETFSKKEQGMFGVASDSGIDIFYSDSYEVSLGVVSLVQPQSIFCSFHSAPSTLNVLRGKYCSRSPQNNTSIWQVPTGATFTSLQNAGVATFYSSERYYTLTDFSEQEYFEIESFLCSKNKDEYSNAQDGY
jgi:hypothetical protein